MHLENPIDGLLQLAKGCLTLLTAERAHLARFRARLRQPVRLRGCWSGVPAASQQPVLQLKPR